MKGTFFSEIIGGLENHIRQNGYYMMLYTAADVDESLRMAGSWNLEGLIVLGCQMDECRQFLNNTSIPLIFIDSYFQDDKLPYVNVGLEDRHGSYIMTKYLIEKGHRKICFLSDVPPEDGVFFERYMGFKQAMKEQKLCSGNIDHFTLPYNQDQMQIFSQEFINNHMKNYTALFFAFDSLALRAIYMFQKNGIKIPDDISICGFDGNDFSRFFNPSLTTIHQDVNKKSALAVNMLMKLIKNEELEQRIVRLNVSITEGESVKSLFM
jgi:LacI family transcriptional regulator